MAHTTFDTTVRTQARKVPQVRVRHWAIGLLLLGLIGAFALSLTLGSVNIPLDNVVRILLGGEGDRASWNTIINTVRLPKALTAMLAGAALAVSGLQMQTLFRNPLADPFVLGISSGASLGVAIVVLAATATVGAALTSGLGTLGEFAIAAAASLGAGLVMALVMTVARRVQNAMTLLILGLMFGYMASSVVSIMLYFSIAERIQAYISWTFGSFGGVTWSQLRVLAPIVIAGMVLALALVKPLNALLLGEAYAASMGVPVRRVRFWLIASASVLTGTVTAFCGPIAFLGLAVPHLCRTLLNTSEHRPLMPAVMLMGGTLALLADLIAQMPGSQITLPLNAVTALVGAPVVIWVVLRRHNLRSAFAG